MGRFKNIVLGDLDGKVGNLVGRRRKGKYFVYAMPNEVKISNSPEAKRSRNIMIPVSKFASIVNSIPELKYIWTHTKIDAFDAFHKIEKVNFHYFIPERPTLKNIIVPECYVDKVITSSKISNIGIRLTGFITEQILKQMDGAKALSGIGVICYFNPSRENADYFHLGKIRSSNLDVKVDEQFEVMIPFCEEKRNNFNSYRNSILYFTFIGKNAEGLPITFTSTYSNEFIHEYSTAETERFSICDSRA
jgi:hypothetical protein